MHCFSESKETAEILVEMGGYFSFGGVITFKNAKKDEIIKSIPLSRILLETDCPYMAPVPYRGSVNMPQYVEMVYKKFCEIKGVNFCKLKEIINQNFNDLFM